MKQNNTTVRFIFHWYMLCVLIPFLSLYLSIYPGWEFRLSSVASLSYLIILYSGTRLSVLVAKRKNSIVDLLFLIYLYVFLGVCSLIQIGLDYFPWPGRYAQWNIFLAQIIILLGIFGYELGRRLKTGYKFNKGINLGNYRLSFNGFYFAIPFFILVSWYAIYKLGGFESLFLSRVALYQYLSLHYGIMQISIYNSLARTPLYVLMISIIAYLLYSRKLNQAKKIYSGISLGVLTILTIITNNPYSTPRFQIGTIVLGIYFILPWKKYSASVAVYGLVLGMLLVFPYMSLYRSNTNASLASKIENFEKIPQLVTGDYDSFQQIMNGIKASDKLGLQYGHQIVSAFLFWIPRSVWLGKAEPTGALVGKTDGYSFYNFSAPLWEEFYVDGGLVFVFFGFIVYGKLVRFADNYRRESTPNLIYIFITIYAGYQIYFLRGSLMPAIAYLAPVAVTLFILGLGRVKEISTLGLSQSRFDGP